MYKSTIVHTDLIVSHADVHADLFRLLVTGRAGVAVTEWLGNRLTGRVRVPGLVDGPCTS